MAKYDIKTIDHAVEGAHFAIVAARFNASVVDRLLAGATATLADHGVPDDHVTVARVPGCFEIPLVAKRLAASGRFECLITIGAVVRGDTPHFEYVAGETARGIARVALDENLPVIFGILTVNEMAEAMARAGGDEGNKGEEAARAALEMVTVLRHLEDR